VTIVTASWAGTAVLGLTALAAVAADGGPVRAVAFAVAVGLFLGGCVAFVLAYVRAVQRSRQEAIGIADLFFLTGGVAPPNVRRSLLGAFGLQFAIGLGAAIARPYTSLAAGTLAPMYGLGLCGLWASRHGVFPPRPPR
jgi:hypothetical protein